MRTWMILARKEKGLTQVALANEIGISPPSLCNIENGKSKPAITTAKKIADVLGFPWTRFFEDDNPS